MRDPGRRLLLDDGDGERRGVVLPAGRPERLLIERDDPDGAAPNDWLHGEPLIARVARLERGLGMAFLDAGPAAPPLTAAAADLREGALVRAEVAAPARADKLASVRVLGAADGALGRTAPRPSLQARLLSHAPGVRIETGPEAREAADAAQEEALAVEHPLPGGGRLWIEPTRAMVAADVDLGASAPAGDPKRRQRAANLAALAELARLLRLKGLGGLVALDLAGKGHDGDALARIAKQAFAADQPGVSIGPISRFGLLELQLPWRTPPVAELLLGADGRPTPLTRAFALLRAIEREAGAGGRVQARCAPAVHAAAAPFARRLADRIGARFDLVADVAVSPEAPHVTPT